MLHHLCLFVAAIICADDFKASQFVGGIMRVVDDAGDTLRERQEGHVEVRGPSLMDGYVGADAGTASVVHDGWLRTGDLGYVAERELFVTGRHKELIVRGGRKIHPYDVEAAAGRVAGVRPGRCAAFGARDHAFGTEMLVVVCESKDESPFERERIERDVATEVTGAIGIAPNVVIVAPPETIQKTGSGKLQRAFMRRLYEEGRLAPSPAHAPRGSS